MSFLSVFDNRFIQLIFIVLLSCSGGATLYQKSKNFSDGKFQNLSQIKKNGLSDVLLMRLKTTWSDWPNWYETQENRNVLKKVMNDDIFITHINHSTVLIQTLGLNIITDPIFSKRCSPVSFIGPKRVTNPGISFDNLPPIDLVLISHDHYDHLDLSTINKLVKRDHPKIFVGLGVKKRITQQANVTELDWWESVEIKKGIKINFVPVQHFSGRGLFDRDTTLWGGYVLELNEKLIYFGGDSGYGTHFKETYQKFGAMDFSLIPIGAYSPRYFMGPVHMDPKEAVQAHIDLKSKKSMGIHFGTFQLTAEPVNEPMDLLKKEVFMKGLKSDEFLTLKFGESIKL